VKVGSCSPNESATKLADSVKRGHEACQPVSVLSGTTEAPPAVDKTVRTKQLESTISAQKRNIRCVQSALDQTNAKVSKADSAMQDQAEHNSGGGKLACKGTTFVDIMPGVKWHRMTVLRRLPSSRSVNSWHSKTVRIRATRSRTISVRQWMKEMAAALSKNALGVSLATSPASPEAIMLYQCVGDSTKHLNGQLIGLQVRALCRG
jgi:hypothetical protein